MIPVLLDLVGAALLVVGLVLITISLYGLLRMTGTHAQLHAQGLATGPGVMAVLASSIATENAAIITFAVLAIAFIAITSPTASNAIARAAHRRSQEDATCADRPPDP
ncbi:Multisubunit Na+/H+ antiporter, MnhG subunit [Modestobacter italicus]|uniref:Multisubunit Na+/H+ antiporter, MnhG subunit n=1 Tax=Modestobacter italicus (strain DSM 44449 / CECT 9708 / BC 501) TaxID=2732864 RepID=I4EYH0_MODI5|nr:monovalent cation/H(+) antiporter subunit G [Modestobacter marinus]CCH88433.1 Multisubunit Na+/H+ antiporter, MnhG subunit [Modestobacter marinus]